MSAMTQARLIGDESALFRAHHAPLVRSVSLALRIPEAVAEDAASVAWIQLVRCQPRRDRIAAWLRVVAVREAIRLWDAEIRDVPYEPEAAARRDAASRCGERQVARELLDAVAGLAPGDREVLIRTAAGYSYSEVAEQAELSVRAVERRLIGARRRLRLELGLRPAEPGPTARPRAARSVAAA
jgi:RNA polymerase sigma-70 factor (ECF subfamily)